MKYSIISINEERAVFKENIRKTVWCEEIPYQGVDGRSVDIFAALEERGLNHDLWHNPKLGELGVWCSNFDMWERASQMDEPLIVFEDDAIPHQQYFNYMIDQLLEELPETWDYCALWVPQNQRQDYLYDIERNEIGDPIWLDRPNRLNETSIYRYQNSNRIAFAYQGYGMVSLMYSPKGGAKLVDLAHATGPTCPVDCWLYQHTHIRDLEGYAPHPYFANVVGYDWSAASHVQQTERAL